MGNLKIITIVTTALFLIGAGTIVNALPIYFMAGFLLVLPAVSYAYGRLSLRDLQIRRILPTVAYAGETVTLGVEVWSRSPMPRLHLSLEDELPQWIERDGAVEPLSLAPGGTASADYRVRLLKRGRFEFGPARVVAPDPMGLFSFATPVIAAGEMLVRPCPEPLEATVSSGTDRFGTSDPSVAIVQGAGLELDGVREYVPGDPLRRLHWATLARTGQLAVVDYLEPRAMDLVLALETTRGTEAGTGLETTLEYLVRVAASLAPVSIRNGASLELLTSSGPVVPAGRGAGQLERVLDALALAEADSEMHLADALMRWLPPARPGVTLWLLLSRVDVGLVDAVRLLRQEGVHVVACLALPPGGILGDRNLSDHTAHFLDALAAERAEVLTVVPRAGAPIGAALAEWGQHG